MGRFTVVPDFIAAQYTTVPPLEHADLSGQTVLVVGANAGLGLSAAKHFAHLSPGKLALACRSVKKGEDAAKEIREETGFENISCYAVDLGVFASVVAFAEEFQRQEGRLDILMYNAGISTTDYERTTDGWETTLQVNDLSCMLLTVSLLPLVVKTSEMTKTAPYRPRIVIVASEGHYWVKPTAEELASTSLFEKLSDPEYCKQSGVMGRRYFFSKLLNVLYARELASRVPSSTAIVNSVNPGLCRSSLARRATLPQRIVFGIILSLLARTSEVGGRLLTWAAVSARHREKDLHGKFITDMQVREESEFAVSPEGYTLQRKLWDESVKILSSASPQFKDIVDRYLSQ